MRIIETIGEMQQQAVRWRRAGKRIVLVPTMGYFHQGHLALMRHGRQLGDLLGVSLFVNPTQFGPGEDFERYPKNFERDRQLAEEVGVDFLFVPSAAEMYPNGYQTYVEVMEVTQPLCGVSRPGHFRGVATVVSKLFNIVKPDVAVFGEKDFQQLVTIQRLVKDLHFEVEVVGHPTVREPDGLAMSSRNAYLTPEQRRQAVVLSQSLHWARESVAGGETRSEVILDQVRSMIDSAPEVEVDYVEIRHPETMAVMERIEEPGLLAVAAYVGRARLIDNTLLQPAARDRC